MKRSNRLPKNTFYCENCDSACLIYKKGKSHRVLVCPKCGVLATNGKGVLKSVAKRATRGVIGEIPGASLVMEGLGLAGDIKKGMKTSKTAQKAEVQRIVTDSKDKPNQGERIINKVLYGE